MAAARCRKRKVEPETLANEDVAPEEGAAPPEVARVEEVQAFVVPTRFVDFCQRFGLHFEPGQLAVAEVLFDRIDPCDVLDRGGDERGRAVRMFGVDRIPLAARRLKILAAICGRRSGKTSAFAWRGVHLAMTTRAKPLPGQDLYVAIVGPLKENAGEGLGYAFGAAREVCRSAMECARATARELAGRAEYDCDEARVAAMDKAAKLAEKTCFPTISEDSSNGFTLTRADGIRIRFMVLSASDRGKTLRGKAFVAIILDEAAMFRGEDAKVNDKDTIDAGLPGVVEDGELLIATSPWTEEGQAFEVYQRNFGHPVDAVVAHAPTWEMRSDPSALEVCERVRMKDEWAWQREYGAKFLAKREGALFDPADLDACVAA